jgi:hypothetical protein
MRPKRSAAAGDLPERAPPHRALPPSETSADDRSPLYSRPFKCKACGSRDVILFAIESQAELAEIQRALAGPPRPAVAPTTHRPRDFHEGLI